MNITQQKNCNMGMFDSVWVCCPECGKENEFQSKSGDCLLNNYHLNNCPDNVLEDINRHSPCHCDCGCIYEVDIKNKKPKIYVSDIYIEQENSIPEKHTTKDFSKCKFNLNELRHIAVNYAISCEKGYDGDFDSWFNKISGEWRKIANRK